AAPARPLKAHLGRDRQTVATGHTRQRGRRATQIVAPRSMSAWFQSPARFGGTMRDASRQSAAVRAAEPRRPRTRKTRPRTRATLVSTAGSSAPKAILATAPAV